MIREIIVGVEAYGDAGDGYTQIARLTVGDTLSLGGNDGRVVYRLTVDQLDESSVRLWVDVAMNDHSLRGVPVGKRDQEIVVGRIDVARIEKTRRNVISTYLIEIFSILRERITHARHKS